MGGPSTVLSLTHSNMNTAVICLLVASVVAMVASEAPVAPIETLYRSEVRDDYGQYSLSFQTANGITVEDHGELKPTADGKDHVLVRSGSFSYPDAEGRPIKTTYHADENGYVAEGDHLPKPVAPLV